MHVVVATDGSRPSLAAAVELKKIADPDKISDITIVAVISPFATVGFANDLGDSPTTRAKGDTLTLEFRQEARNALNVVKAEYAGWGPKLHTTIRSGSAAAEIIKCATELEAGLVVLSSGGRGLTDAILLGSTATRVQYAAPCPVLVVRAVRPRKKKPKRR